MALKGKPREHEPSGGKLLLDPNVQLSPGRVGANTGAQRNELLEAEAELRRLNEQVAAPAPGTSSGRPHQGGLPSFESAGRWQQGEAPRSCSHRARTRWSSTNMMFPRAGRKTHERVPQGARQAEPAACRAAVPVVHIGPSTGLEGAAFHLRRADQPRRDSRRQAPIGSAPTHKERGWRKPAAAVLAEQHLQPRLPMRKHRTAGSSRS